MVNNRWFFGLVTWVWLLLSQFAPAGSRPIQSVRLDVDDGLSHSSVYAIVQDKQGFMWFGTQNGLNRYDGYRMESFYYDPRNPEGLSHGNVAAMAVDEEGFLWLGTWGGGLNRLDPKTGEFLHFRHDPANPESIGDDTIHQLFMGRDHTLWIGGMSGGLTAFDTITHKAVNYRHDPGDPASLSHNHIWTIYESPKGEIWVGTDHGLDILSQDHGAFVRFLPGEKGSIDFSSENIRCLVPGREARLWIGTSRGLALLDSRTGVMRFFKDTVGEDFINTVFEDRHGNPYVGGIFGGLRYLDRDTGQVSRYVYDPNNPAGIGNNDVRCLYEDRSGNLWIGTRGGGISKINLKQAKFQTRRSDPNAAGGLPYGEVSALLTGDARTLWVGLRDGGLYQLDRDRAGTRAFRADPDQPHSLSDDRVRCLEEAGDGNIWVGALEGLNLLDTQTYRFTRFSTDQYPGLVNNRVNDLMREEDRLWIATDGGLVLYKDGAFTASVHNPDQADSAPAGRIHVLFRDAAGTRWLGSHLEGLSRFDPHGQHFKTFQHNPENPDSLSNNYVISLNEAAGDLWVGTWGGGLNRMNRDTGVFTRYTPADGLTDTVICGILVDAQDRLWIATTKGVNRFDPQSERFRSYGEKDGLQGELFSVGAVYRASSGEMFMGGSAGFSSFFPEQVQDDYFVPEVVISRFEVDGKRINPDPGQMLKLNHQQRNFAAEFAALDFTAPMRNRFTYKLEGLEERWSTPNNRPYARYTNLSPGRYRFQVKAANHDGVWNEDGIAVAFLITPPWYQTWWALSTAALLLVAMVTLLLRSFTYRARTRAKMELLRNSEMLAVAANRGKSAFLAHMGHELRTPLNAIIGYSELVAEDLEDPEGLDPSQCLADLAKIKSSAHYQLGQVNNLLEFTKIDTGETTLFCEDFEIKQVVDVVKAHLQPMLEKTGNRLIVTLKPQEIGAMTADVTKVRAILMNLVDNANKFTKGGRIDLRITRFTQDEVEKIRFQVQDTGVGMSPEKMAVIFRGLESVTVMNTVYKGPGLGLYICQHFCKMMGGAIEVESEPARGSTFTAVIPSRVTGPGAMLD